MKVSASETLIEAIGLRKSYGSRVALDGINLAVHRGEVAGLLGPNGAGKTTTLSILTTLLRPDAGEVRIGGRSVQLGGNGLCRKLGFVPQSLALYQSLSALENLELFARLHGIRQREARALSLRALDTVGLAERGNDRVADLSGGMKRRLNVACGMVHDPEVLLLDEPAVGVDPQSREQILLSVRGLADAGAAVIYSTHYMEEVERLCERIFLIDNGRVVAQGTVAELIALGGGRPLMEIRVDGSSLKWCSEIPGVTTLSSESSDSPIKLQLAELTQIGEVLERARTAGLKIQDFTVHSPNLSDAFMALTGHRLRDPE